MVFALITTTASVAAEPYKLDGRARALVASGSAAGLKPRRAAVFVQTDDIESLREFVAGVGGRVGSTSGDLATVTLPRRALSDLAALSGVRRVEAGAPVGPRLDRARVLVAADRVLEGAPPLDGRYSGRGVVVGIIDFAFDAGHAAFRSGGLSRVHALWDMSLDGRPPPGFEYGLRCDQRSIAERSCPHVCADVHGTHVAGIAAGGTVFARRPGADVGAGLLPFASSREALPYIGIAPRAALVLVAFGDPGSELVDPDAWLTTSVCDGVRFVFDEARHLGLPAVVNISLGSHAGPHDGSSLADACLDALVGPGRIIVAAAGNEGEGALHPTSDEQVFVHAAAGAGATPRRLGFRVGTSYSGGAEGSAEIWTDAGGALEARVGVRGVSGAEAVTELVGLDAAIDGVMLEVDGSVFGPVSIQPDEAPSGARALLIDIADSDDDMVERDREWFVELSSTARFDAFSDISGGGGFVPLAASPDVSVDGAMTVGYPALARGVIAVGSYTSRATWNAANGDLYEAIGTFTGERVIEGELSAFSSRGPTRDPSRTGPKPEITAPGEMVASALAVLPAEPPERALVVRAPPGGFMVASGTSQAAPVVAGAIALMLERDPGLTPDEIRALFRVTADAAPGGDAAPSDAWGYGKLNAFEAVATTREINRGQSVSGEDRGCAIAVTGTPAADRVGWILPLLAVGALVRLLARARR